MSGCAVKHPDHPDLACILPRSPREHPQHLTMRYRPGVSQPEQITWDNPNYRSPQQRQEQAREAKRTVLASSEVVSREILARRTQKPLGKARGQRKKTRLGLVADLFVNNVGTWVPGHRLATQEVGGTAGLRRVIDLRNEYGWHIVNEPDPDRPHGTDRYMLVELPDEFKDAHAQPPP